MFWEGEEKGGGKGGTAACRSSHHQQRLPDARQMSEEGSHVFLVAEGEDQVCLVNHQGAQRVLHMHALGQGVSEIEAALSQD